MKRFRHLLVGATVIAVAALSVPTASAAPTRPAAAVQAAVPVVDLRGGAVYNNDLGGLAQGQSLTVDVRVSAATASDPYYRGLSAVADGPGQPAATDRIRFWINGVRQPDITPDLIDGEVYFDAMDNRAPVDLAAGKYRLRFSAVRLADPVDRLSFVRVYPFGNGG